MTFTKGKAPILQAHADFKAIQERWLRAHIISSTILPRWAAWEVWDLMAIERVQWKVNWEVGRVLLDGLVLLDFPHPMIQIEVGDCYRGDGSILW